LDRAALALRRAYDEGVLRLPGDQGAEDSLPHLSTGFPRLDRALGIGGLPKGHLSQISGRPTSRGRTLACRAPGPAVAEAVRWIDLPGPVYSDYAARWGVDMANLLLVQPSSLTSALDPLAGLLETAAAGALVLDSAKGKWRMDTAALGRLLTALHRSR